MTTPRSLALFAVISLALITAFAWVAGLFFETPEAHRAIRISAVTAFVVQLFTFAIARLVSERNVIAGWGLGALLRLVTLAVYGLVMVKALGLPAAAALISLATFLFVSTLVEPLLLKQ